MAKISPVSIKYIIHAKFESEGTLEKPDVIGALFGQTEGLLGEELELRELQKEGKIGRIDVNLKPENGKTIGDIQIPSSIDKAETTIIAAALETIERIGPSDSKITVERIEDVRGSKREYIIDRAKKLLAKIEGTSDSREIEEAVKLSSRTGKLQEYGEEKLPAGDLSSVEIVVVEGRADVLSLLRANVANVIAMNGTILPETIKELSKEKEVTLFVDGDRGGKLIAKNAIENAEVKYVAVAPDGKEVEELTPKEILSALRKKIKAGEFLEKVDNGNNRRSYRRETRSTRGRRTERSTTRESEDRKAEYRELEDKEIDRIREMAGDISGTKNSLLLDENLEIVRKVSTSQLYNVRNRNIFVLVIDGTATANIVRNAEKLRVQHLAATNFGYTDTSIDLVSL
jgi:DNA primase